MSWMQKCTPSVLHQSSPIPYVLFPDKVLLCYSNSYSDDIFSKDDYSIKFNFNKNELKRQSATYYKLEKFPVAVNIEDVLEINIPKESQKKEIYKEDPKNISILRSSFLNNLNSDEFEEIYENMQDYDYNFILTKGELGENTRALEDVSVCLNHDNNDWGRTCVNIAHLICQNPYRGEGWTENVPDIEIGCYGLKKTDYIQEISSIFSMMNVNIDTSWEL